MGFPVGLEYRLDGRERRAGQRGGYIRVLGFPSGPKFQDWTEMLQLQVSDKDNNIFCLTY